MEILLTLNSEKEKSFINYYIEVFDLNSTDKDNITLVKSRIIQINKDLRENPEFQDLLSFEEIKDYIIDKYNDKYDNFKLQYINSEDKEKIFLDIDKDEED